MKPSPRALRSTAMCALACTLLLASGGCAERAGYPDRPITLVCPWSVGGGTDRVSRQLAFFLERELGQPVNVINATGGRGVTGHARGLHARPDGYTIAMITLELNMLHWQDLTTIGPADAEPLLSVNEDPAAIWVRNDSPWRTLADLRADVAARPGSLKASGTAFGGAWHLALAGWLESAGLASGDVVWVPMGGAAPSLQELASDGLDLVCCSLPEAKTFAAAGEVRCLGVMSADRIPGWPDVPTFREQGFDWTLAGWRGLAVPKGTPPEIVERLVTATRKVVTGETQVAGRSFPDFMAAEGFDARWRNPDEFADFLRTNDEKFGRLLTSPAFRRIGKGSVGPFAFPTLLGVAIGLLAVGVVLRERWLVRGAIAPTPAESTVVAGNAPVATSSWAGRIDAVLVIAAIVAYVALSERLGFVVTASALLLALLIRLRTRWLTATAIALVIVPATYHVFAHVLRVPLPRGVFGW